MTEFNLNKETDNYSRSFGLCVTGNAWGDVSSCEESVNYMSFFNSLCGTMTEGGSYLMADYKGNLFKLGSCGLEQIDAQLIGGQVYYWRQDQFCGKIKGGAAFCVGNNCVTYSDETGETTALPTVDGYVHFDEGSVFTAGPDDTLIILGGTKSDWYYHYPDLQNMTRPEQVDFVGQYFDVAQNRWMPLDYYPGQTENDKLNFPLRYQKTVYREGSHVGDSVILYRTNEVNLHESTDELDLWRDGPTYLVNIANLDGIPKVISIKLSEYQTGGPEGAPNMNVFTGYGDNTTYYTEDASHYIAARSNNFEYTVHAQVGFCQTSRAEIQPLNHFCRYKSKIPERIFIAGLNLSQWDLLIFQGTVPITKILLN